MKTIVVQINDPIEQTFIEVVDENNKVVASLQVVYNGSGKYGVATGIQYGLVVSHETESLKAMPMNHSFDDIQCEEKVIQLTPMERKILAKMAELEEAGRPVGWEEAKVLVEIESERETRYGIDDEDFADQCPRSKFD